MNEIEKLIKVNVLRDIELEILKSDGRTIKEIIKDLEVRYGYSK